ncbi:unnamed protein product [Commensalibacter communis]|uniref:hypothetical protein n=1 Tax=Commensalibacter communis TaxID=2972786 RepID=UPI0022FFA120|nr:hypothetical protein [Commensalibacter communis]CAI3953549.1 unnamed protein product [Commensalibacter communis]
MNKLLYTSALCAFTLFLGSTASKAIDFPEHYRTLDVHQEFTKQSTDFKVKNVFPFFLPDNLPGVPVFKGAKGQFSTTAQANLDPTTNQDITSSETLFGVEYVTDRCPKAGQEVYAMDQSFPGIHYSLIGNIVKQTQGNKTQVSNIDFMNSYGIPMNMGKNGCGVLYFDGSDFQNKPYAMKADLQLKYTFQPISIGLDGEFIISANNQVKPALNAYVVIPVTAGEGKGQGVIRPGTVFAVSGNISTAGVDSKVKGNWYVRYITAVYKNNSCQIAFKNHSATKFFWNDNTGIALDANTGTSTSPNNSSALQTTATIIADFTVAGKDRESIMRQVNGNQNLPVHVEDGDCVVQAALPYGDSTSNSATNMNMESQTQVVYIPD